MFNLFKKKAKDAQGEALAQEHTPAGEADPQFQAGPGDDQYPEGYWEAADPSASRETWQEADPYQEEVSDQAPPAALSRRDRIKAALKGGGRGLRKKSGSLIKPKNKIRDEVTVEGSVVSFGSAEFAAGLFWTEHDQGVSVKDGAREVDEQTGVETSEDGYSLWADRRQNGMIGFTKPVVGHKAGMPALVTTVSAGEAVENWLGVFLLDERVDAWWLGSVRDGKIFEDQIIRSRMMAEDLFMRNLQAPGLEVAFAPEEWGVNGTRSDRLADLINPSRGSKVKHVRPIRAHLPKIIAGATLLGIVVGGIAYYSAEEARKIRELEELQRMIRENVAVSAVDLPWFHKVPVNDFIEKCEEHIRTSVVIVPGWASQPVSCSIASGAGSVTTGWTRADGTFAWLRASVPRSGPQPLMSEDGRQASRTTTFEYPLNEGMQADTPWEEARINGWLRERFQNFGLEIELRPSQDNRPTAEARPQFNATDIRLTSTDTLKIYGDLLKDVPAMTPVAMIYNIETNTWDLVLKAYHPVILPVPK